MERRSVAENIHSAAENILEANRLGVEMLIEDADIGLTLLKLAQTNEDAPGRSRRVAEAHKAYKSILSLLKRLRPDATQMQTLEKKMKTLAKELRAAGVQVD